MYAECINSVCRVYARSIPKVWMRYLRDIDKNKKRKAFYSKHLFFINIQNGENWTKKRYFEVKKAKKALKVKILSLNC